MSGDFAIDTNIAIYAFSESPKAEISTVLIESGPRLSVQLLNEFANVRLNKHHIPWPEVNESLALIEHLSVSIRAIDQAVHNKARQIAQSYKLSFYDSLMISAALLDACEFFFTEDMQHGLVIENTLKILNPFLDEPA
jgi:predicted nucleic acid-binding protein